METSPFLKLRCRRFISSAAYLKLLMRVMLRFVVTEFQNFGVEVVDRAHGSC